MPCPTKAHLRQRYNRVSVILNGARKRLLERGAADSGRRRTGFRGEAEQRSGLIPNAIPG